MDAYLNYGFFFPLKKSNGFSSFFFFFLHQIWPNSGLLQLTQTGFVAFPVIYIYIYIFCRQRCKLEPNL